MAMDNYFTPSKYKNYQAVIDDPFKFKLFLASLQYKNKECLEIGAKLYSEALPTENDKKTFLKEDRRQTKDLEKLYDQIEKGGIKWD